MGVSFLVILLFLLIALPVGVLLVRSLAGLGKINWRNEMLNCPLCGKETRANFPTCDHCGEQISW